MTQSTAQRLAALAGFTAVALGAFGAHGLKLILEKNFTVSVWQTAALYHLVHAVVLLVLSSRPTPPRWPFFLIGIDCFLRKPLFFGFNQSEMVRGNHANRWRIFLGGMVGASLKAKELKRSICTNRGK